VTIASVDYPFGRDFTFIGDNTFVVAINEYTKVNGTSSYNVFGAIQVFVWNGTKWDLRHTYSPPVPEGLQVTDNYVFGFSLTSHKNLLFATSQDKTVHVMKWNGSSIVPVGSWKSTDPTKNFANCPDYYTCEPSKFLVVNDSKVILPGTVASVFDVSYSCQDSGYRVNFTLFDCDDIDECSEGTSLCNITMRPCINTEGSYFCQDCGPGFKNNGNYECEDIDECTDGTHKCSPNRTCINTWGNYSCSDCPTGLVNDGLYNCTNNDPCNTGSHQCVPPRNCTFLGGTNYNCTSCPTGYSNQGPYNCLEINECTSGTHRCTTQRPCINNQGGYTCQDCPSNKFNNGPYECSDVPVTVTHFDTSFTATTGSGNTNTNGNTIVTTVSPNTRTDSGAISIVVLCLNIVLFVLII